MRANSLNTHTYSHRNSYPDGDSDTDSYPYINAETYTDTAASPNA